MNEAFLPSIALKATGHFKYASVRLDKSKSRIRAKALVSHVS